MTPKKIYQTYKESIAFLGSFTKNLSVCAAANPWLSKGRENSGGVYMIGHPHQLLLRCKDCNKPRLPEFCGYCKDKASKPRAAV